MNRLRSMRPFARWKWSAIYGAVREKKRVELRLKPEVSFAQPEIKSALWLNASQTPNWNCGDDDHIQYGQLLLIFISP
jgi:hypothetical protein